MDNLLEKRYRRGNPPPPQESVFNFLLYYCFGSNVVTVGRDYETWCQMVLSLNPAFI